MNKKGETMGVREIIIMIIAILVVIAVVSFLYRAPIETMLRNMLPSLNGSSGEKYDEITGEDEEIENIIPIDTTVYDDHIFVENSKNSKIGINNNAQVFDGKFWILDNRGTSKYYFKTNKFVYGESVSIYTDSDKVICVVQVGFANSISSCNMFIFGNKNSVKYFVLGGYGQFMFFESLEDYNNALTP